MKIYGIGFEAEGVSVGYSLPGDSKDGGRIMLTRTLNIANTGANADSIHELREIIEDFILDMIERFDAAEQFNPDDEEDDEDDAMGSAGGF